MNPIVVFDLGKVLVDFDYTVAAKKIAARSTKHIENLHDFLGGSSVLIQFETGLLTNEQFFREIQNATGFTGSADEFAGYFADIFVPIPEMVRLHDELRQKKIPTYIFSNTNDIAISHVRRRFPFFGNFDGYILSYQVGAMKPNAKIYEALEELAGRRGPDIFYIDDRPENVHGGAARGWQVVMHESPDKTRAAMNRFLSGNS